MNFFGIRSPRMFFCEFNCYISLSNFSIMKKITSNLPHQFLSFAKVLLFQYFSDINDDVSFCFSHVLKFVFKKNINYFPISYINLHISVTPKADYPPHYPFENPYKRTREYNHWPELSLGQRSDRCFRTSRCTEIKCL